MAVTSIWDVKGRVATVIKYVANPQKTSNTDYKEVASFHRIVNSVGTVIEYTADQMKTEKQLYCTGINCSDDPKLATKQFGMTKDVYGKQGGIVCYHGSLTALQPMLPAMMTCSEIMQGEDDMKISKELLEKAKQAKSADGGYVYSLSNGETKGENSLYR